ncbi:MAG: hypothetical protein ACXVI9_01900, partial [Mucilaginibacter sp.]
KLMSWRMWTTYRSLPTAPFFEWFDHLPAVIHTILFVMSLLSIVVLFFRRNLFLLTGLLIIEVLSCLLDQNRWLPWEYLYIFIIFIFIVNATSPRYIAPCIAFLLISTYFYSGLCKLNEGFLSVVWTNMILTRFLKVPANISDQSWVHYSGHLLGLTEMLAGIGLFFVKTQVRSAKFLIVMHLGILLLLGPFVFNGYEVLWPWNTAMILFLYFIFLKNNESIPVFHSITQRGNKLILICWGILPVLSFWGYWDKNLSSNLFSANLPGVIICVRDTSACRQLQRFCYKKDSRNICNGQAKIDIQTWARLETNVSVYPEMRVYKIIEQKLTKQYSRAGLSFVYFSGWNKKR